VRKSYWRKRVLDCGKRLNADDASITKPSVTVMLSYASRVIVVAFSIAAWFSISNHCALGALEQPQSAAAHATCHGNPGEPANSPAKDEPAPCCKLLRATLAKSDQPVVQNYFTGSFQPWVSAALASSERFRWQESFEWDTGPPFCESFAESVLQRSILAHAPPILS
jgi:hypothetical protein